MKPTLKAPESKRLKLKYDKVLSTFAFKFNLRCYTTAETVLRRLRDDRDNVDNTTKAAAAAAAAHARALVDVGRSLAAAARGALVQHLGQGLTLVHFSPQFEPCLKLKTP